MSDEELTERDAAQIKRTATFQKTLLSDEDMVAVIRGHLLIERGIDELIQEKVPHSERLLEYIDYSNKCRLIKSFNLVPARWSEAFEVLGKVRNQFAHRDDRKLSETDDNAFAKAMRDELKQYFDHSTRQLSTVKPGNKSKLAMVAIYAAIHGRLNILRRLVAGGQELTEDYLRDAQPYMTQLVMDGNAKKHAMPPAAEPPKLPPSGNQ